MFTTTDLFKHKIDKLMANPDKPIEIPKKRDKKAHEGPDFVRNVMGSSAGAGSGEFHVYRHLRRKEYARQKEMEIEAKQESLNDQYHRKLEENKRLAEERTSKKRNKRLKKKEKLKRKKIGAKQNDQQSTKDESSEDSDSESDQSASKPVENEINENQSKEQVDKETTKDELKELDKDGSNGE